MSVYIAKNKIQFFLLFVVVVFIASISLFILPGKFFYDAETIVYDIYNEAGYKGSYPLTMTFYDVTKLKLLPFNVVGVIQCFFYFFILFKIGVPKNFHVFTLKNMVIYLSFLMIGIFIAMPSKEFITFLYVSQIVFILNSRQFNFQIGLLYSFVILIVFGIFFRSYFALIPIISIALYFLVKIKYPNRALAIIFNSILIIVLLSFVSYLYNGDFFSEVSRKIANENRENSVDANSMIIPPFSAINPVTELINSFYAFLSVNFPITEYRHFLSPRIAFFIVWQILFFALFVNKFTRVLENQKKYREELWIFLFLFSYFAIQGVFEPDLGSAIRHKIGVLPLIYYAFYYEDFKKKY